jgi:polysaccharide deacetylase family protein (PEP-CTERM system associated)
LVMHLQDLFPKARFTDSLKGQAMSSKATPLTSCTITIAVVAAVAIAASLLFGQTLHWEPFGLFFFGLFCTGYAAILSLQSRKRRTAALAQAATTARPRIVREADGLATHGQRAQSFRHALTIDLEDYFHTEVAAQGVAASEWEHLPSRIEASTHQLLDLLEEKKTQATFFVLGWVARRYPGLVQEIQRRGHEIGCHSLNHRLVCRMTPKEFYENTRIARDLIESITGEPVLGYRAPCFSITPGTEWAFDVLAGLGFTYDSSVHPVHHPLYGNPTAPRGAYRVASGRLTEFPIATWRIAGRNFPIGGGAYLRLLPYQYVRQGLRAWETQMQAPAMLYLHPWEIDPYQPYLPLSIPSKIRQTWGTATMESKLRDLLENFRFAPVRDVHISWLTTTPHAPGRPSFQRTPAAEQVAG